MIGLLLNVDDVAGVFAGLLVFAVILGILFYAFYMLFSAIGLALGFEQRVLGRASTHNKILAFQCIGTYMVLMDKVDLNAQISYLIYYLKRIFPHQTFQREHLIEAYQKIPFDKGILNWINKHLSETEKLILIEFLIDLAFHNHVFTRRELAFIQHTGKAVGLEKGDIQSILRVRYEQKNRANEKQQERTDGTTIRKNNKVKALQILGLPASTADFELVRRAYRTLARKHHPDRFAKASAAEQRLAHERFSEITNAHDTLRGLMT